MAFGQELKDFVSGFKAGYDMFDSKEDKEWEREKRRMQKEGFERTGQWRDEDRADRAAERDYQHGRDAVGDDRWNKSWDFRQDEADWQKNRAGVQDERWLHEQGLRERELRNREDAIKIERARDQGAIPDGDDLVPIDPYNTNSIQNSSGAGSAQPSSWLQYDNENATRNKPMSAKLESALGPIATDLGLTVRVFSGGQDASGPNRTGSHRHDHGNAADVFIYKDGKKLDWANPQDRPIFEELVKRGKDAGITGFGAGKGYMQPGSMHLGYGAPAVWGAGGSGDNAPGWLRNAYAGNYASGGMVAAIPEDNPEEEAAPSGLFTIQLDDGQQEGAIPEEVADKSTPKPSYDGAAEGNKEEDTDDPYELGRRAVRDGLNKAIADSGAGQDSAIADPELEKIRQNYIRGYGAAPSQMMRQVLDKVDPDKKMAPGERNMMAMGTVYRYYMNRGEMEKAQEAAKSMVQYYRQTSQQYLALSQAAAENGDIDAAAKAAMAAYANVPNGRDLDIKKNEDGTVTVSVTDAKTGKAIERKVMSPRDFAAAAMQFNPTTFDDEIMNAAGMPADKYDEASIEDLGKTEDAVRANNEGMTNADGSAMDPKRVSALSNVASGIASIKQNGMGPQEAMDFVRSLSSFDADDPKNDKPGYKTEKVRGNPDLVKVTMNGKSVVMDRGKLADLTNVRGTMAGERAKGRETDAANAKWWNDQTDLLDKGINAFGEAGQGAIDTMEQGAGAANAGASIGGMVPQEEGAIPTDERPSGDLPEQVRILMNQRQNLLSNPEPAKVADRVRIIEQQLAEMGYPVNR